MKKRQKAFIFDMDGLLIDSEPLWQQAEIEVFETIGISLTKTMSSETMGLRTDEVVKYWADKFPNISFNQPQIVERLINRMKELIITVGQAMPGAIEAVQLCKKMKVPLGLATSSSMTLVTSVLQRLELTNVFEVITSAEKEPFGKPHPAVYLTASDRLGIPATNCIAFEDSLNGVISAKAARMKCIAVPSPESREEPQFALADVTLSSLEQITQSQLEEFLKL
ncbi:hexitol phosphatase HxpB [Oscillatoria salina]|uniref:hexitol phosphatase HxpB n=1 Tax=Oscillatoria salina TaxID=331517 RepID=UPI0013B6CC96|nr:hexitol phosphatase HxpB [Oscillatoria salina]MBZ8179721.1 hexitol phosphatase HxpB [Oscillatoria salina IIICB1]NET87177.1 hexitol phosphatase HxpB [Kamptonema sp. SIO1D9]